MNDFGLTSSGFVGKTFEDVLTDLNSDLQREIPGIDVAAPSVAGTLNAIYGLSLARVYQAMEALYSNMDDRQASGFALDLVASFRGLTRNTGETDADFRARVLATRFGDAGASSQQEKLCAALQDIDFINSATVVVNDMTAPDSAGIPGNSYVPIVYVEPESGSCIASLTDAQIEIVANTLIQNHPLGVNMYAPPTDAGYQTFDYSTECGTCIPVNFVIASKLKGSMVIDYRVDPGCSDCGNGSEITFNSAVVQYLNSSENCNRISGNIYGSSILSPLVAIGNIFPVNYQFRLHLCGDESCEPFYTEAANVDMDVGGVLQSLSVAGSNPINSNYAFIEFDESCFNGAIV